MLLLLLGIFLHILERKLHVRENTIKQGDKKVVFKRRISIKSWEIRPAASELKKFERQKLQNRKE